MDPDPLVEAADQAVTAAVEAVEEPAAAALTLAADQVKVAAAAMVATRLTKHREDRRVQ